MQCPNEIENIAAKILRHYHEVVDRYDISISEIGMDLFPSMYIEQHKPHQ
jgi:hypothetical protein